MPSHFNNIHLLNTSLPATRTMHQLVYTNNNDKTFRIPTRLSSSLISNHISTSSNEHHPRLPPHNPARPTTQEEQDQQPREVNLMKKELNLLKFKLHNSVGEIDELTLIAKEVLGFVECHVEEFNGRDWGESFFLLKKFGEVDRRLGFVLLGFVLENSGFYHNFLGRTIDKIQGNKDTEFFNAVDLSMIATSVAKIGKCDSTKQLFASISSQTEFLAENGTPRELANIAYAFAKLGIEDNAEYFAGLSRKKVTDKIMDSGTTQAISNIAWAYANLKVERCSVYFNAISDPIVCERIVTQGTPQEIANIATSFWKLSIGKHRNYFTALSERSVIARIMEEGDAQNISNIATAYSKLGVVNHADFFAAINDRERSRVIVNIENNNLQEIANIATSFSVLQIRDNANFFDAISEKDVSRWIASSGNTQAIANIATAFAYLDIYEHVSYFSAINDPKVSESIVENAKPLEIASIAIAFAKLDVERVHNYFRALTVNPNSIRDGDSKNITNVLWSIGCLGLVDYQEYETLINTLWRKAMTIPIDEFAPEGLIQLHQFYTFAGINGRNLDDIPLELRSCINDVLDEMEYQSDYSVAAAGKYKTKHWANFD